MSNKQLDVQIMGQSYILGCPEGGEERLLAAVAKVDFSFYTEAGQLEGGAGEVSRALRGVVRLWRFYAFNGCYSNFQRRY